MSGWFELPDTEPEAAENEKLEMTADSGATSQSGVHERGEYTYTVTSAFFRQLAWAMIWNVYASQRILWGFFLFGVAALMLGILALTTSGSIVVILSGLGLLVIGVAVAIYQPGSGFFSYLRAQHRLYNVGDIWVGTFGKSSYLLQIPQGQRDIPYNKIVEITVRGKFAFIYFGAELPVPLPLSIFPRSEIATLTDPGGDMGDRSKHSRR